MILRASRCSALRFMPEGIVFGGEVSSLNEPPSRGLPKGYENASGLGGKGPENKWTPMNNKCAFCSRETPGSSRLTNVSSIFIHRENKYRIVLKTEGTLGYYWECFHAVISPCFMTCP